MGLASWVQLKWEQVCGRCGMCGQAREKNAEIILSHWDFPAARIQFITIRNGAQMAFGSLSHSQRNGRLADLQSRTDQVNVSLSSVECWQFRMDSCYIHSVVFWSPSTEIPNRGDWKTYNHHYDNSLLASIMICWLNNGRINKNEYSRTLELSKLRTMDIVSESELSNQSHNISLRNRKW